MFASSVFLMDKYGNQLAIKSSFPLFVGSSISFRLPISNFVTSFDSTKHRSSNDQVLGSFDGSEN